MMNKMMKWWNDSNEIIILMKLIINDNIINDEINYYW